MPRSSRLLLPLLAVLALPASAHATTFCVGEPVGCVGVPESAASLPEVLTHPKLDDGEADVIQLAAGSFTTSNAFVIGPGSDPVTLRGAGAGLGGATTITSSSTAEPILLDLVGDGDHLVTVEDLVVSVPSSWAAGAATAGVRLRGALNDAAVQSESTDTVAVRAAGDTALSNVSVKASSGVAVATATGATTLKVKDSYLSGRTALRSMTTGTYINVARSVLRAAPGADPGSAAALAEGQLMLSNSIVKLNGNGGGLATGVTLGQASLIAYNDTIVGVGKDPALTRALAVTSGDAASDANMKYSIVTGVGTVLERSGGSKPADVWLDDNLLPAPVETGTGAGTVHEAGTILGAPVFADEGFQLAPGSPGLDQGPADAQVAILDFFGNARVQDGDGDGVAIVDLGAVERPGPTPPAKPGDGGTTTTSDTNGSGTTTEPTSTTSTTSTTTAASTTTTTSTTATTSTTTTNTTTSIRRCRVPKLRGLTLAVAKRRLARAGCKVGHVRGKRGHRARVRTQSRKAGMSVRAGTRVALRLKGAR